MSITSTFALSRSSKHKILSSIANNLEKSNLSEFILILPNKFAISSPVFTYSGIKFPCLVSINFLSDFDIIGLVSINIFLLISSKLFIP